MAKFLNLATAGIDPRDYATGQVPVADGAGLFAPGEGGGGGGGTGGTYSEVVGDGSTVTFDVTHDLATSAIVVAAWEVSSGDLLDPAFVILTDNSVRVVFPAAPATDDARVVIVSGGAATGASSLPTSRAHKTDTSVPGDTMPWTNVDYDDLGAFDLVTDDTVATIQEDGRYLIAYGLHTTNAEHNITLRVNTVQVSGNRNSSGGGSQLASGVWSGELVAGDVIDLRVFSAVLVASSSSVLGNWLTITKLEAPAAAVPESPGSLLAVHSQTTLTASQTTTSTTFVDVEATELAVTFDAPASGKILVRLTAHVDLQAGSAGDYISWNVREGASDVAGSDAVVHRAPGTFRGDRVSHAFVLEGVAAGSHTYKWGFAVSAGTARMFNNWGPFVMEVWSA